MRYGQISVDSLRVLPSSGIECAETPPPGFVEAAARRASLPRLAPDEEMKARAIVLEDAKVRELVAGKRFSIDFVGEWDLPQRPGREARVDLSLDRVYQIDYAWPWPPSPISTQPHQGTFWVREMTVVLCLDTGTVLGIMPERHSFAPSANEGQGDVPTLSSEEEADAKEIALQDARIQQVLTGKGFSVASEGRIGVWHSSGDLKKLGAILEIRFDMPYVLDIESLSAISPVSEDDRAWTDYLASVSAYSDGQLLASGLQVMVSFEDRAVVQILPLWEMGGIL